MYFITEADIRELLRKDQLEKLVIRPGTRLTPSASQLVKDLGIEVVEETEETKESDVSSTTQDFPFMDLASGVPLEKKAEHYTHLRGTLLVPKTHPRIIFRGSLDNLEAVIIEAQVRALEVGRKDIYGLLMEMEELIGKIFRAEVKGEELPPLLLFGLNDEELRQHSHNPIKYYGVKHFKPSATQGKLMSALNLVRVTAREAELKALEAFWNPEKGVERADIILALNRMSSAAYILMCRLTKAVGAEEKSKDDR